jgi:hypothetical protein
MREGPYLSSRAEREILHFSYREEKISPFGRNDNSYYLCAFASLREIFRCVPCTSIPSRFFEAADDGGIAFAPEAIDVAEAGAFEQTKLLQEAGRRTVHLRHPAARLHLEIRVVSPQRRSGKIDPLDIQEQSSRSNQFKNLPINRTNELEFSQVMYGTSAHDGIQFTR